jgi:hypothetical protein
MFRRILFASCAVLALAVSATAQPGKTKAPLGTWVREAGDARIEFKFEEKAMKVSIKKGDDSLVFDNDYGVGRGGVIFGRIYKVDSSSGAAPDAGTLFAFKAKVAKDTLTISDLTGTDNAEARQLIEGDYKLQPKGKD